MDVFIGVDNDGQRSIQREEIGKSGLNHCLFWCCLKTQATPRVMGQNQQQQTAAAAAEAAAALKTHSYSHSFSHSNAHKLPPPQIGNENFSRAPCVLL